MHARKKDVAKLDSVLSLALRTRVESIQGNKEGHISAVNMRKQELNSDF
jgi:hypothetical protein